jgi:hypothetical protein
LLFQCSDYSEENHDLQDNKKSSFEDIDLDIPKSIFSLINTTGKDIDNDTYNDVNSFRIASNSVGKGTIYLSITFSFV